MSPFSGLIQNVVKVRTRGGLPEVAAAWAKALELAESLGDLEYQKRSLWGLVVLSCQRCRLSCRFVSGAPVRFPGGGESRPERSTCRRADDRRLATLPRRSTERARLYRTGARRVRCSGPPTAIHSPAARRAAYGPRPSCANPLAAGLSGSRDPRSRTQRQ
jgi:hypothetical protein